MSEIFRLFSSVTTLRQVFRFFLLFVLITSGGVLCARGAEGKAHTSVNFKQLLPDARQEGNCFLVRIEGCDVIAAMSLYGTEHLEMVFVHGKSKKEAADVAEKIKDEIAPAAWVRPFEDKEPWVAIIPQNSTNYFRSGTRLINLMIKRETKEFPLQFIGWEGKLLRVRTAISYTSSYFSTSYSSGRKSSGVVEMLIDLTQQKPQYIDFNVVEGKPSAREIALFIARTMMGAYSSTQNMSKKELAKLRKDYPGATVISLSENSDLCIIQRKKIYRAGPPKNVQESLKKRNPLELASFQFPAKDAVFPPQREALAADETTSGDAPEKQTGGALAAEDTPALEPKSPRQATEPEEKRPLDISFREAFSRYISKLDKL